MHALHKDARFILGPDANVTKYVRIIDQFPLNDGGNLVALRHNVVGDHAIGICRVQRSMKLRQVFWRNDPRLVGKYVHAGFYSSKNAINLLPVATGQDRQIPQSLVEHPLECVGSRVDFKLPTGGVVSSRVETGDPLQVCD